MPSTRRLEREFQLSAELAVKYPLLDCALKSSEALHLDLRWKMMGAWAECGRLCGLDVLFVFKYFGATLTSYFTEMKCMYAMNLNSELWVTWTSICDF